VAFLRGDLTHPEAWEKYIVPEIRRVLGLAAVAEEELTMLPYSMPRGRFARAPESHGRIKKGDWILSHGGDAPSEIEPERIRRSIMDRFHLNAPAASGRVHWSVDEHETMIPSEKVSLGRLIGSRIPY
jgi:hypothetical protein